jgi:surface protein
MKILNQIKINKIKNIILFSLSKIYNYNYELTIAKDIFESLVNNEKLILKDIIKYYKKFLFFTENFTNYETIINLLNFQELSKVKEIKNFMNEKNDNKFSFLEKDKSKLKRLSMLYKNNNNDKKIRIFGKEFVKNNESNCHLIINNERINKLCEFIEYKNMENMKNMKITLIEIKTITDMSYMFSECSSLVSLAEMDNFNLINVNNIRNMFNKCISLVSLDIISNWNISNINDMSGLFKDCSSLKSLI